MSISIEENFLINLSEITSKLLKTFKNLLLIKEMITHLVSSYIRLILKMMITLDLNKQQALDANLKAAQQINLLKI